jgi:ankyrin repeat protein
MTGLKFLQFGLFLILLGFTVNLFATALFFVGFLLVLTMSSPGALELSGQLIVWGQLTGPIAFTLAALGKLCCLGNPEEKARNFIVGSVLSDLGIIGAVFIMFTSVSGLLIGGISIFILVIASYVLFLKFLERLGENIGEPRVAGLISLLVKLIFTCVGLSLTVFIAPAVGFVSVNLTGFAITVVYNYTIYLLFRALPLYISEVEAGITDPRESGEARKERERKERMEGPKGGGPAKARPPEEPQGTPPEGHLLYRIPKALEPLHLAVKEGDRFKVETQLAHGADCNQAVRHGLTPLHIAASVGVMDVADALIKAGAHVDATCEKGLTPVYFAVQTGNPNIVGFFINKGANLFHRNEDGHTPLHWACCAPHPGLVGPTRTKMVQLLISQGGDLMARNNAGKTPRDLAVENQLEELVSAIDRHMGSSAPTPMKSFEQPPGQVSGAGAAHEQAAAFRPFLGIELSTMPKELSELLAAVKEGEPDKIKRQIVEGANINETTVGGIAPIHITAITGVMSGTDLLLSLGANVDDTCDHNLTPLFLAVHANNVNMVGYLKSRGANLNHRDELGRTPLHWAAAAPTERLGGQNRPKMVEFLLNQGADPSIRDNDGQTALNLAQAAGVEEVVSLLGGAAESEEGQGPRADDDGYYV